MAEITEITKSVISSVLVKAAADIDILGCGYIPFHIKDLSHFGNRPAEITHIRKSINDWFLALYPEYEHDYLGYYEHHVIMLLMAAAIAESEGD